MKTKLYILAVIVLFLANTVAFAQFTNIAVTTNTRDQSETTIAISPLNSNYLLGAWNDFRSVYFAKPGYAFSTDGGSTWNDAVVTPPGYEYGFDPSVAFDKYGNAYYCYVAAPDRVLGPIYVSRTTTFQPPFSWNHVQVSTSDTLQDKPYMAVDNGGSHDGRIYVSWTDFSSGSKIKFAYSTDRGVSFSNASYPWFLVGQSRYISIL